eukprot:jgi/Picsp_1/4902/NSC_02266-R1_transmembrane protein 20 isoform 1
MVEIINTCRQTVWSSGVTCVAIAAFFYSIATALVRPIDPSTPVFEIVFVRSVFSLIFSLLSARYGSKDIVELRSLFGQLRNVPLLAFRGLAGAAAMDCFYYAIQRLFLAEAVALLFLNPVVTAILAWTFLGESLSRLGVLGVLVSLSGMVLVVQPPFLFLGSQVEEWSLERTKGVIAGGSSALLAGFAFMTIRWIGNKERSLTVAVWFHMSALVHSAVLLVFGVMGKPVVPQGYEWLCFIGIALESAALGSAINYSQVVYANIVGIVLFHEPPSLLGVAGAICILSGVVALAISTQRQKKSFLSETDAQQDDEEQVGLLDDEFTSYSYADKTNRESSSEAMVQLSSKQ